MTSCRNDEVFLAIFMAFAGLRAKNRTKLRRICDMCKKKRKNLRYFCIFSRFRRVARGLGEKKRGFGSGEETESGYRRRFMAREYGERGFYSRGDITSRLLANHIRLVYLWYGCLFHRILFKMIHSLVERVRRKSLFGQCVNIVPFRIVRRKDFDNILKTRNKVVSTVSVCPIGKPYIDLVSTVQKFSNYLQIILV